MARLKAALHKSFRALGFDITRAVPSDEGFPPDFGEEEIKILREVRHYTKTSPERIYALIQAVRYLTVNNIKGSIVECGVWKGGSMAAAARTLMLLRDLSRELYLFDTFEGMSEPTANDIDYQGEEAAELLQEEPGFNCDEAGLNTVKNVLKETRYPTGKTHFVVGRVEHTLPASAPESIALLRLDTDWYESTKHELIHLFPRVVSGGVLIIDDYGHWKGARKACDEYFSQNRVPILLNRIDYTGRISIKP
jgi:O-methyltransferase